MLSLPAPGLARPGPAAGPSVGAAPHRPHFHVVVVDRFTADDLRALSKRGAVGLLVPGVGSLTSRRNALAALVRGTDLNPYLSARPVGRSLLDVSHAQTVPAGTGLIVVALPPPGPLRANDRRYPIAILGGGFHGLLTSPTTRIAGLVSIVDVAPTALGHLRGSLGSVPSANPVAQLTLLDGQIHANNRLKMPTLIIVACVLLALAAVRSRGTLPAVLAALVTNLCAGAAQVSNEPLLVAMVIVGTIAGGLALTRVCVTDRRLLAAILVVLFVYLAVLLVRPQWVAIAPLGPTQNSRFWGIGNQLETLLLAPVLAGAALAARRYGLAGFGAFSLLALVLVTDNHLGSDGGGAIVFGVALAFVGARVLKRGLRAFVTLLLLDGAVALGIVLLNLRLPGPDHLRSVFSHGLPGLLAVLENRVPLAYLPALHQWPLLLPLAVLFVAAFVLTVRFSDRPARDLLLGAGLALATSLLLNDSGTYELAGGVSVLAALAGFTMATAPVALAPGA